MILGATDDIFHEYEKTKITIEGIEQETTKGAIRRSKAQWAEAGENNSKYFLNLEKRNAINKTIVRLQNKENKIIVNPKEILDETKLFYKTLYTEVESQSEKEIVTDFFPKEHPALNPEEKQKCEGLLTPEECASAIKNMKNGKSPGTDGFTVEFYKFFWNKIKNNVVDSLNYAFSKGELSLDQRRGIITLIPKKDKSRIVLKNWRPISLLNIDYKILTKSLAFRLQKVLPSIIDFDQTGFLKGRYIGENIRTISDIIDYSSIKNIPGIILLIDFEKAFDTVRWSHLIKCLEYFNFGPSLIQWIKTIYCKIGSIVINNGHSSNEFTITRGIRQGCPISPYLFLIAVEVLAISIRSNKNISGIKVGNTEIKISQLADDTTLLLANLASVKHALTCLSDFQEISGLKVNIEKTIGMGIGSLNNFEPYENCGIKWTSGPITTLGVTISNEPDKNEKCNFKPRLKIMSDTLNIWLSRNLSLNGKVTILKSIAIPKLQYVVTNLPITNNIIKDTEKVISNFLWKYKTPKVKKSVIIQPIKYGGIKAPDFTSIVKACRVSWIKRLLSDNNAKWKSVLQELVHPISIEHLIQTHLCDKYIDNIPIPFYRQILRAWNEIKESPKSSEDYIEQIIWNNKFIQIPTGPNKKSKSAIFYPKLYRAGIVRIGDLITENGDILDFKTLNAKYDVRLNILTYYQILKAIPQTWIYAI